MKSQKAYLRLPSGVAALALIAVMGALLANAYAQDRTVPFNTGDAATTGT